MQNAAQEKLTQEQKLKERLAKRQKKVVEEQKHE
jgi:hypothetical protein